MERLERRLESLEARQGRHGESEYDYVHDPNGARPKDLMYHAHFRSDIRKQKAGAPL